MTEMAARTLAPPTVLLTPDQERRLAVMLEVLAADEHAPTAIRDPRAGARLHLADSLAALALEEVRSATRIADLGSGAGFPGLPLAVALPAVRFSLVESQQRKCDFLARIRAAAGVDNAQIVCARAEEWREGIEASDMVVARALASQPVVLEYASPLLVLGGALVDWRGKRSHDEEQQGDLAAAVVGMQRAAVYHVAPVEGATDHHLHLFVKVADTPPRFPRRPGMARKRPLGSGETPSAGDHR